MKIAVLTTVYERPQISTFHFYWMSWFKFQCSKLGVELIPFYVLSTDDSCLNTFKQEISRHGYDYTVRPKERLSVKTQNGLHTLRDRYEFDYLMHLDSDEILSTGLLKRWLEEWQKENSWFGSASCYFYDIKTRQAWEFLRYSDHPVKNGGTCIHYQILMAVDWELWPMQRSTGLNIMERRALEDYGYVITPIDTQDVYGVVEIKGGGNAIHNLDWFRERQLLRELKPKEQNEMFNHFPMLRNTI